MRQCRHKRTGIMTNQPNMLKLDRSRPHAATSVCERPECQQWAQRWVAAQTNEPAEYVPDKKRS